MPASQRADRGTPGREQRNTQIIDYQARAISQFIRHRRGVALEAICFTVAPGITGLCCALSLALAPAAIGR